MKKRIGMNTRIVSLFLILITASIACETLAAERLVNVGGLVYEDFKESCVTVSRSRYETAAAELGVIPETPKYPEAAVYEVCYIEQELKSVRMSEGYRPAEDETEPDEEPTDHEENDSGPAGTYVGTSDYPEVLVNLFGLPGEFPKNEVFIRIAADGKVSGSYMMSYKGSAYTVTRNGEDCTEQWDAEVTGTFSGQLTGSEGLINFEENWVCAANQICEGQDPNSCGLEMPSSRIFSIQISNGKITGSITPSPEDTEGYFTWTFVATKE